jgi:Spy/CpxP family protein refolding chaperone
MNMISKFLAATALGTALIATPALAQSTMSPAPSANKMRDAGSAQTASASGLWQGSKLVGLNVYNDQNQKIGSIVQLMVDKNGKIDSVVIGVGGFLGMGERDVAVKFSELKWSNEPVPSTTSGSNPPPATNGAGTTSTRNGPTTYPDHAVFNATKDQLKAMPQFDYNK